MPTSPVSDLGDDTAGSPQFRCHGVDRGYSDVSLLLTLLFGCAYVGEYASFACQLIPQLCLLGKSPCSSLLVTRIDKPTGRAYLHPKYCMSSFSTAIPPFSSIFHPPKLGCFHAFSSFPFAKIGLAWYPSIDPFIHPCLRQCTTIQNDA